MAPVSASGQKPQTKYQGRAFGLELGSAEADCFSWAAPQVGRNYTSISPFTFSLWGFHCDVCDVLSLGIEMPSSGGQFWGWCRHVKIRGQLPPGMSRRHPSSSCGTGGWPRDVPPHPFKVKLGDHFSAVPEITPGWGLAPGCGTHGTPLRCRSEMVGLPRRQNDLGHHATLCCATTSAIVKLSEANPQGGQRRQSPSAWIQTQERNGTPRPSTQTLAAVLLLIGWSQRLKKTETPQRKPPKIHGQGPTISRKSQRL